MPVLSLACHLPHNTPNIPPRYNNEQTTKQTKAINNSYIYIYISHVNVTQTVPDISPLMPMHQNPLLVSYLEAQVTWNFSSKSLDHFLSSFQVTWKPSDLAKSQVTLVADLEISWFTLTSLFVFCIFLNQYMWHYMVCFTTYLQKAVRILFIDKLGVRGHWLRQHHRHRGLLSCCIQWRHYSVDA